MADDKPDDTASSRGATPDGGRPKRAGPTIEVEARRVAQGAASDKSGGDKGPAGKPDEAKPAGPVAQDSPVKSTPSVPSGGSKPAAATGAASAASAASSTSAKPEAAPEARPTGPAPGAGVSPVVAGTVGAISGAIAAAVLFGVGASSGWLNQRQADPVTIPPPEVRSADLAALTDRIAKIEAQPAAAAPVAAPAGRDPEVDARITELEKQIAGLRDSLSVAQAESSAAKAAASAAATGLSSLQGTIDGLKAAPAAAPVDLSAITARLGAIERAAATLKTEAAQQRDKPLDDAPLRRVVAVAMLDDAVRDGEPFADAFAAMRFLVSDQEILKPLEPFATTGVPLRGKMLRDLQSLVSQLTSSVSPVPADASWLDRMQAGALRLVKIRRTDGEVSGAQVAAVSRLAAAVKRSDLAAARKEIDGLAPADKAKVQVWADLYDARRAALAASQKLAAEASASLSKPAQ